MDIFAMLLFAMPICAALAFVMWVADQWMQGRI